jgi:hypothetical protein
MAKKLAHPARNLGGYLHPTKKKPSSKLLKTAADMQAPAAMRTAKKTKKLETATSLSLYPKP